MSADVVEFGPHTNMTPDEAVAMAQRRPWQEIIIVGFTEDSDGLVVFSSHMAREKALWIIEHAKLHAMDRL